MNADVKITVLKRSQNRDFLDQYAEWVWEPCERLNEGDEFIAQSVNMPTGFCTWAWSDIAKYVLTLSRGGNFLGVPKGIFITCCTDGYRPVFFKLERIET